MLTASSSDNSLKLRQRSSVVNIPTTFPFFSSTTTTLRIS